MRLLLLGAKEYPFGSSRGFDSLPGGGYERFTEDLANELVRKGNEVSVITRRFGNQEEEEIAKGVRIKRVKWVPGFLFRGPSFNLFSLSSIMQSNYDCAITSGFMSSLMACIARIFNNKPVIYRQAGNAFLQPQYPGFLRSAIKVIQLFALKSANHVIFLSEEEKQICRREYGFFPRSTVIPTGIELKKFNVSVKGVRRGIGIKENEKMVFFVGRLLEVKGVKYLLEAMREVNAKLVIAGTGKLEKELKEQVKREGIEDKVIFVGQREDIPALMKSCDVFAFPSLSEGLPIALLEAMAAERACVCTDIGLPARNNVDALVVKKGNSKELAAAINKLLKDEGLRKTLGRKAREKIERNYSWDKCTESYLRIASKLSKRRNFC